MATIQHPIRIYIYKPTTTTPIQIDDPFCSEVDQIIVENREVLLGFTLQGVPVDKLEEAPKKY